MALHWVQVERAFIDGPEISRIAGDIKLDEDQVLGKAVRLWAWSQVHARPRGVATGGDLVRAIERAVGWDGEQGAFVAAFTAAGVLSSAKKGIRFRGWEKRYGAAEREADRKRLIREQKRLTAELAALGGERPENGGGHPADVPRTSAAKKEKEKDKRPASSKLSGGHPPDSNGQNPDAGRTEGGADRTEAGQPPAGPRDIGRTLSAQERFYREALQLRALVTSTPDQAWPVKRQNTALKQPLEQAGYLLLMESYRLFLLDEHARGLSPPLPMWAFCQDWSKWWHVVKKERPSRQEAASPPPPDTEAGRLWASVLDEIRRDGREYTATLLARLSPVELHEHVLTLDASDGLMVSAIQGLYGALVEEMLAAAGASASWGRAHD